MCVYFYSLEALSEEQEQEVASKQITNKAPQTQDMFQETRDLLREFFRPFNRRLAELLADKEYTWGY